MVYLNCYLLKTEIVDTTGEPVGELPQYLMQVEKRSDSEKITIPKFVYINDTLEDINLDELVIQALREEKIIKDKFNYIIDINNNAMVIEFNKGIYSIVD